MGQLKAFDVERDVEVTTLKTDVAYYTDLIHVLIKHCFSGEYVDVPPDQQVAQKTDVQNKRKAPDQTPDQATTDEPAQKKTKTKRKGRGKSKGFTPKKKKTKPAAAPTKKLVRRVPLILEKFNNSSTTFRVKRADDPGGTDEKKSYINKAYLIVELIKRVAMEEDRYYYSWHENGAPLKDQDGKEILTNLVKANAGDCVGWRTALGKTDELQTKVSGYVPMRNTQGTRGTTTVELLSLDPKPTALYIDAENPNVGYNSVTPGTSAIADTTGKICFYYVEGTALKSFWAAVPSLSSGGGGGAMRADKVSEVDYRWTGNQALGLALGLEVEHFFPLGSTTSELNANIEAHAKGYFATNVPWDKKAPSQSIRNVANGKETDLVQTAAYFFMGSEILYLKKFKDNTKKRNSPAKPAAPRIPVLLADPFPKGVRNVSNIWRKKQKGERSLTGSPTGLPLRHRQSALRHAAGAVMSDALRKGESGTGTLFQQQFLDWVAKQPKVTSTEASLAATDFARFVIQMDADVKAAWLRDGPHSPSSASATVETDQEWCHMYGHGDGGSESLCNFVSGSNHCNTEQLAIEIGQRKGKPGGLSVRVTAYLLTNKGGLVDVDVTEQKVRQIHGDSKLNATWEAFKNTYFAPAPGRTGRLKFRADFFAEVEKLPAKSASCVASLRERLLSLCQPYPLANWIRYKIYSSSSGTPVKIFDHIFDAQGMSFNYHEFKILKTTVERVIAVAEGTSQAYEEGINNLISEMDGTYSLNEDIATVISAFLEAKSRTTQVTKQN